MQTPPPQEATQQLHNAVHPTSRNPQAQNHHVQHGQEDKPEKVPENNSTYSEINPDNRHSTAQEDAGAEKPVAHPAKEATQVESDENSGELQSEQPDDHLNTEVVPENRVDSEVGQTNFFGIMRCLVCYQDEESEETGVEPETRISSEEIAQVEETVEVEVEQPTSTEPNNGGETQVDQTGEQVESSENQPIELSPESSSSMKPVNEKEAPIGTNVERQESSTDPETVQVTEQVTTEENANSQPTETTKAIATEDRVDKQVVEQPEIPADEVAQDSSIGQEVAEQPTEEQETPDNSSSSVEQGVVEETSVEEQSAEQREHSTEQTTTEETHSEQAEQAENVEELPIVQLAQQQWLQSEKPPEAEEAPVSSIPENTEEIAVAEEVGAQVESESEQVNTSSPVTENAELTERLENSEQPEASHETSSSPILGHSQVTTAEVAQSEQEPTPETESSPQETVVEPNPKEAETAGDNPGSSEQDNAVELSSVDPAEQAGESQNPNDQETSSSPNADPLAHTVQDAGESFADLEAEIAPETSDGPVDVDNGPVDRVAEQTELLESHVEPETTDESQTVSTSENAEQVSTAQQVERPLESETSQASSGSPRAEQPAVEAAEESADQPANFEDQQETQTPTQDTEETAAENSKHLESSSSPSEHVEQQADDSLPRDELDAAEATAENNDEPTSAVDVEASPIETQTQDDSASVHSTVAVNEDVRENSMRTYVLPGDGNAGNEPVEPADGQLLNATDEQPRVDDVDQTGAMHDEEAPPNTRETGASDDLELPAVSQAEADESALPEQPESSEQELSNEHQHSELPTDQPDSQASNDATDLPGKADNQNATETAGKDEEVNEEQESAKKQAEVENRPPKESLRSSAEAADESDQNGQTESPDQERLRKNDSDEIGEDDGKKRAEQVATKVELPATEAAADEQVMTDVDAFDETPTRANDTGEMQHDEAAEEHTTGSIKQSGASVRDDAEHIEMKDADEEQPTMATLDDKQSNENNSGSEQLLIASESNVLVTKASHSAADTDVPMRSQDEPAPATSDGNEQMQTEESQAAPIVTETVAREDGAAHDTSPAKIDGNAEKQPEEAQATPIVTETVASGDGPASHEDDAVHETAPAKSDGNAEKQPEEVHETPLVTDSGASGDGPVSSEDSGVQETAAVHDDGNKMQQEEEAAPIATDNEHNTASNDNGTEMQQESQAAAARDDVASDPAMESSDRNENEKQDNANVNKSAQKPKKRSEKTAKEKKAAASAYSSNESHSEKKRTRSSTSPKSAMVTSSPREQPGSDRSQTESPGSSKTRVKADNSSRWAVQTDTAVITEYFKFKDRIPSIRKQVSAKSSKKPLYYFQPDVRNDLEPYLDTSVADHVVLRKSDAFSESANKPFRYTAMGLVEPEVELFNDQTALPAIHNSSSRWAQSAGRKADNSNSSGNSFAREDKSTEKAKPNFCRLPVIYAQKLQSNNHPVLLRGRSGAAKPRYAVTRSTEQGERQDNGNSDF